MQINPYESPHAVEERVTRSQEATYEPSLLGLIVVPLAGIVGGSLFMAIMEVLRSNLGSDGFYLGLVSGTVATYIVLIGGDRYIHTDASPYVSAVIGMFVAAPIAWVIAFGLGLITYGMASREDPAAWLMAVCTYLSFFLTLSLGGWMAICLRRSTAMQDQQNSKWRD